MLSWHHDRFSHLSGAHHFHPLLPVHSGLDYRQPLERVHRALTERKKHPLAGLSLRFLLSTHSLVRQSPADQLLGLGRPLPFLSSPFFHSLFLDRVAGWHLLRWPLLFGSHSQPT